jgi:hypothetical protein
LRNSIPAAVRQQPGGNGGFVFPRSPGQSWSWATQSIPSTPM